MNIEPKTVLYSYYYRIYSIIQEIDWAMEMDKRSKTVCFSGHRVLQDPKTQIEKKLEAAVRKCIGNGAECFVTGGALGFDTIAARTVIRLREEFPQIKLILALPCPPKDQTLRWSAAQAAEYQEILGLADDVKVLSPKYTKSCMLDRNRYMVDNSSVLIYYLRSNRGGTRLTVNYALTQNIELVGI